MPNYNQFDSGADAILRGLYQYHQEHQKYDAAFAHADALSRIGIDKNSGAPVMIQFDEKGKPINSDNVLTFGNPKAIEAYKNFNRRNAAYNAGVLDVYSRLMGNAILKNQAGALNPGGAALQTARTRNVNARTAQLLGLLPPKPAPPPTGGQIMAEQRSLRKEAEKGQKNIEDKLAKIYGIVDPSVFVDPTGWEYGTQKTTGGGFLGGNEKTVFAPNADNNPANATHVRIQGQTFPLAEANVIQGQAAKWKAFGDDAEKLKKSVSTKWTGLSPDKQSAAIQFLLQNPTPEMRTAFDEATKSPGLSDLIINAQSRVKPQPESTPAPEPEDSMPDTEEDTSSGE